jgi:hypothetical protein
MGRRFSGPQGARFSSGRRVVVPEGFRARQVTWSRWAWVAVVKRLDSKHTPTGLGRSYQPTNSGRFPQANSIACSSTQAASLYPGGTPVSRVDVP